RSPPPSFSTPWPGTTAASSGSRRRRPPYVITSCASTCTTVKASSRVAAWTFRSPARRATSSSRISPPPPSPRPRNAPSFRAPTPKTCHRKPQEILMNHLEPTTRAPRRGMPALRAWAFPCLAATLLLAATALSGCTQTEPDTDTSRHSIRLTGRVVGHNNAPVAGVAVSLSRAGLTDTTDALGRYVITRRKAPDETNDVVLDTLRYSMGGQALARVNVMQWIDTLPDIQVIQRDISGLLDTEGLTATRIEGVLTGDGIDEENPVTAEFYYNPLTGNYSGFLFFPPVSSVAHYSVQINVYGAGDVLIGQSAPVPFNSFAGNITVPAFP